MYKYLPVIGMILCLHEAAAQIPEDALRFSRTTPGGTAREQAIGGAMGSLGGEITAGFVNPAGLGLYKTNEVVLTPGWQFLINKSSYLGTTLTGSTSSNFSLGASGAVFSFPGNQPGISNSFVIAVNRTADFNSHVTYQGVNNYSSSSEQYAEEFAASGLDIGSAAFSPSLSYGTRMAIYTYLIDTATVNGTLQVIGQPQKAGNLLQRNDLQSRGGITEIDLSLASSQYDKWYLGASLGIPILDYTRDQTYTESDASGNPNNDFESFTYRERYTTQGWGINGKVGLLFRPGKAWRFGVAIHTPSLLSLTDRISASMITRTENYTNAKQISISSDSLDRMTGLSPSPNSASYTLYTPWKFLVSASYVIGSGEADTRRQKGFISADLEYVTTSSPHYETNNDDGSSGDYYDQVNQAIHSSYKGTLGARLGGEWKLNTWMLRAGGAWYSSPYADGELKADRIFLSTGGGYRKKGFFIDLAWVMQFSRDVSFPYRLADKGNVDATLKQYGGTAILTAGIKF